MQKVRLFFIYEKNKHNIKKSSEKDKIILLDKNLNNTNCFDNYLSLLTKKEEGYTFGQYTLWTQKWALKKFNKKKSFVEELIFEGTSLWYFFEFLLQFPLLPEGNELSISTLLSYIDCIEMIIDEVNPESINVENLESDFNKLVLMICKKKGIELIDAKLAPERKSLSDSIIYNPLVIKNYIRSRIIIRKIIGKIFCRKFSKKDIIILTNSRYCNNDNANDLFWGPVVKELDKNKISYKVIEYDQINIPDSLITILKRYLPQRYDAQFIGTYYDSETNMMNKKIIRFLNEKFIELDNDLDFKKSLNYRDIYFYGLIRGKIKKIFYVYSLFIADVFVLGKSIIKKENPRIVMIDHEKNYYGKSLLMVANKEKILTLSMEGEMVYKGNYVFMQESNKQILNKKSEVWRPIADVKFLSGEFSKLIHETEYYFPKNNLEVIGLPKYDLLKRLEMCDKLSLFKKYGINHCKRLITIITVRTSWEHEYLENILEKLEKFKDIVVIIKQHPDDNYFDKLRIQKLIRKFTVPILIIKNENTSILLYSSDFVISYNSTIVNECILMNKRIILFQHPLDKNMVPWVDTGLIKPAKNFEELRKRIRKLEYVPLFDKNDRERYIKKYLYNFDGKASERLVNRIKKILA